MKVNLLQLNDGFAVETREGLIFTVKGAVPPPGRVIAYLRYLPDRAGDRHRNTITYRRVYQFIEQQHILKKNFPQYLGNDPCLGIPVQRVKLNSISRQYNPCQRLAEIHRQMHQDDLEQKAAEFSEIIQKTAGINLSALGISGSVMLKLHRPSSDLDFIVYGRQPSLAVHEALLNLLDSATDHSIKRLTMTEMIQLHNTHLPDTPIPFKDFAKLQDRKINEGVFKGTPYFIRFVKLPSQIHEKYNDPRYESLGNATITARVTDNTEAIFTPCTYKIQEVTVVEGPYRKDLCQIASFRGRFTDQIRTGEMAIARGNLERVIPKISPAYCRLTIGGTVGDYLKTV